MKLLFFDDFKLGVLKADQVVDVSALVRDIPHTGPHNLISGLIERFGDYRGKLERPLPKAAACRSRASHSAAAAETRQYRLHGGQLYGGWHAQGACADQRFS